MEPRGCNQWQSAANRMVAKGAKQAKTVAVVCDPLARAAHGKEGVSGLTRHGTRSGRTRRRQQLGRHPLERDVHRQRRDARRNREERAFLSAVTVAS